MNKIINYTTWCSADYPGGIKLAEILTEHNNKNLTHKVGRVLNLFHLKLKDLSSINSKHYYKYFLNLLMVDTKNYIKDSNLPNNVETHLLTLIVGKYRAEIKKPRQNIEY